jgi:trimethylamine:corrinoid methyltransferase-like protein
MLREPTAGPRQTQDFLGLEGDRIPLSTAYAAPEMLELRHHRYFLAAAEDRNFSRAAERLHMAQSPLSAAIRQLE